MKILKNAKALPLIAVLLLVSGDAWASVGRVLYALGKVTIETPAVKSLKRGDRVDAGNVINTDARGYVQLRLDDGTKVAIRPNSTFTIDALEMPASGKTAAIGAGKTLKAEFSLQRGGFRTITGRIARLNPAAYRLSTPSAVIRVRGTNFTARQCAGDCGGETDDGLYVGVSTGGVTLENNAGSTDLDVNQFGYARDLNTVPEKLLVPPSSLSDENLESLLGEEEEEEGDDDASGGDSDDADDGSDDDEGNEDASDDSSDEGADESGDEADKAAGGDDSADATSSEDSERTADASANDTGTDTGSSDDAGGTVASREMATELATRDAVTEVAAAPTVATTTTTVTRSEPDVPEQEIKAESDSGIPVDITGGDANVIRQPIAFAIPGFTDAGLSPTDSMKFDAAGGLSGFQAVNDALELGTWDMGTSSNTNLGQDSVTSLKWGRWSEEAASPGTDAPGGQALLTGTTLHWVLAPVEEAPAQEMTGSASYVLVGNTDPTDDQGHIGVLGSASLSANFTTSVVSSSLQLGINEQVWSAEGTGDIGPQFFQGLYPTVSVDGATGGSGSFSGMFSNFSETRLPGGAGMTYDLTNGSSTVTGAAIFNRSNEQ